MLALSPFWIGFQASVAKPRWRTVRGADARAGSVLSGGDSVEGGRHTDDPIDLIDTCPPLELNGSGGPEKDPIEYD